MAQDAVPFCIEKMDSLKELFAQSRTRYIVIVGILVVALAVPLTMRLVGEQQDLRQRASEGSKAPGATCASPTECSSGVCYLKKCLGKVQTSISCTSEQQCASESNTCPSQGMTHQYWACQSGKCVQYCNQSGQTGSGDEDGQFNPDQSGTEPAAGINPGNTNPGAAAGSGSNPSTNTGNLSGNNSLSNGSSTSKPIGGTSSGGSTQEATGEGSVSGYVFLDQDYDRNKDAATVNLPADPGISGVTVTLRARTGGLTKTATTNGSGKYEFTNLPLGTYDLRQSPPSCYETGVLGKDVTLTTTNKSASADFPLNKTPACGGNGGGGGGNPVPTSGGGGGNNGGGNPFPTGGGGNNACNATCTSNAQCTGAGGCSVCVRGRLGRSTCQKAPSPTPTPSATITNTPTPTGTPIPTPTVTIGPNDIGARIQVTMPGIGTQVGDNRNPLNPNRTGDVQLYNTANQIVATKSATFTVNTQNTASSSAYIYTALVNFGSTLPEGFYYVASDLNNTLITLIPGVLDIKKGPTGVATAPATALIPGDLDRNNILDMRDYTLFVACYGTKPCAQKTLADFNDNGTVEPVDYNILLRSFAIRVGD